MNATKKVLKKVVEQEQKRVILVTISEDGNIRVQGDHISFNNLEQDDQTKEALKRILTDIPEESETSYNFGGDLFFVENSEIEFPKMFAKIEGNSWKGAKIDKTLSKYFSLLGYGLNNVRTYGKEIDKPVWWPRKPRWANFINPSKTSKKDCTLLIKCLLEHYGIDPAIHYVDYPDEEEGSSTDSSFDDPEDDGRDGVDDPNTSVPQEVADDNIDLNNSIPHDVADADTLDEEYESYQADQDENRRNYVRLPRSSKRRKH